MCLVITKTLNKNSKKTHKGAAPRAGRIPFCTDQGNVWSLFCGRLEMFEKQWKYMHGVNPNIVKDYCLVCELPPDFDVEKYQPSEVFVDKEDPRKKMCNEPSLIRPECVKLIPTRQVSFY